MDRFLFPEGFGVAMKVYSSGGKRFFDIVISLGSLLAFGPLIGVIMLLSTLIQGRPVFFRQQRPGLRMNPFMLYKFRTMTDEYDTCGALLSDMSRITPFGRFLRNTSLDELPELWSVVKGEMSLVGPRPLLMEYLPLYSPAQMRRHDVRPGITGWSQIHGRNALSWEERFCLDVWYVDHSGFALDFKILILTLLKVLQKEGINQPGRATMDKFQGGRRQL